MGTLVQFRELGGVVEQSIPLIPALHSLPHFAGASKALHVSYHDETVTRARHGHVQELRVLKGADSAVLVRNDGREDDHVLLSALEALDRAHFDVFALLAQLYL